MIRLNELTIKRFRGISNLELKGFGDLNLIVGDNNVGKTTILEAIKCFENPSDFRSIVLCGRIRTRSASLTRRVSFFDAFISFFPYDAKESVLELTAVKDNARQELRVTGNVEKRIILEKTRPVLNPDDYDNEQENSNQDKSEVEREVDVFSGELTYNGEKDHFEIFSGRMVVPLTDVPSADRIEYISAIEQNPVWITRHTLEFKKNIARMLQLFDEDIMDFEMARDEKRGNIIELIRHKKLGLVPLYTFGDGLKHALSIATYLSRVQNGILLIDEIETSIHFSILKNMFQWLSRACKEQNVQLIATSHSLEAVEALIHASDMNKDQELVLFRIEKYKGRYYCKRFSESQLDEIVSQQGMDVR